MIRLPTFAELRAPHTLAPEIVESLADVDPAEPRAENLFRVHWYNRWDGRDFVEVPDHVVLGPDVTGIDSPVVVLLGNRFPMIGAHKVLPAYACLAVRLVEGTFDPAVNRAIWPSTGNYARGGVAISRIMGCRGVAVLPENMSRERFEWLDRWTTDPADVVRTPGSESNVKEIYDACKVLAAEPGNVVINQFSEFANHVAHYTVTGPALEHVMAVEGLTPSLFVSASGSAGTLGAGDYLKERHGTRIAAAEALECPTMLYNGFGEHNIQGIGDKHIPLIHNVMNTDVVVGVSDRATDTLGLAWREEYPHFGFSSICNVLAAIKSAKRLGLGPDDAVVTVATDGSELYRSENEAYLERAYGGRFTDADARAAVERYVLGADTSDTIELTHVDRTRIFNLGYFTWVEQQGISVEDFDARRDQAFWAAWHAKVPEWDEAIIEYNARTG